VEELLARTAVRHLGMDRRDRAFLLELAQGVKRWEIRLDYCLSHLSHIPLKKLHPLVLVILRLAAFQILMLDKVPARAAVHEAGEMARQRRLPKTHLGFINAVLRRLAEGELPSIPSLAADPVMALSIEHSHPAWLVRRWLERYGLEDTQARLAANNRIPPLTIRVNTLKTDPDSLRDRLAREGIEAAPCRFSPGGLRLGHLEVSPMSVSSYWEGLWLFQDEAAQLVTYLLNPRPGQTVLELGAGRGGKTTHMAELMTARGVIMAVDNHKGRLQDLRIILRRWGVYMVQPHFADATRPLHLKVKEFDSVAVDAPCSALGIIRRHPEIKTRLKEADLATFPPRQQALLAAAAPLIKSGGRLLYITCTTEPEENQEVVEAFLAENRDFRLGADPGALPSPARSLIHPPGYFVTSPATHDLDAFFAAVLVRG